MKRSRLLIVLFAVVLVVVCIAISLAFSDRTATWQIQQVFPGAQPYFDPLNSPDSSVASAIRTIAPTYVRADESVGFSLEDSPEALDLHARFSRLAHLHLFTVSFTRCKISNLCPTGSVNFPLIITFDRCDFSALSKQQRAWLRPDPTDPNKFCLGDL